MRKTLAFGMMAALAIGGAASVADGSTGRLVYWGTDAASGVHHPIFPEAVQLVGNAVTWVGKSNNPVIGYAAGEIPGEVLTILTDAGFTNLTELTAFDLANIDLSGFDMLYIGVVLDGFNYAAADANVQSFFDNGGGLVAEAELFGPGSWEWLPFADLIGHSGDTNIETESVTIVKSSHPVMAGLTDAGLSDWLLSVHSHFTTPEAAGFTRLAIDKTGAGHIIAVPAPSAFAMLLIGTALGSRRRRA